MKIFKKINPKILIFLTVLSIGIFSIKINDPKRLQPDSFQYHNLAVNIAKGNGYSASPKEPFQEYYLREPGYPFFLSAIYSFYCIFGDISHISYFPDYDKEARGLKTKKEEIIFAQYVQLFLICLSVLLFYKTIIVFVEKKYAMITTMLLGLYYPFVISHNKIMRETLLIFFVALMGYFFVKYIKSKKLLFLGLLSFFIALSILTFQAMLVYLILPFVTCLLCHKLHKRFWIRGAFALSIIIITLSPWLIKVYNYYPDVRIIKTVGCSLTHEGLFYYNSARKACQNGIISRKELEKLQIENWYSLSPKEQFNRSFNGWYISEGEKLRDKINTSLISEIKSMFFSYRFLSYSKIFINTFIHNDWEPLPGFKEAVKRKSLYYLLPHIYSLAIGLCAIFGLIVFPKKKLIYLLPYLVLLAIFFKIGDEGRRLIPSFPVLILFSVYFLFFLINYFHRKNIKSFFKNK